MDEDHGEVIREETFQLEFSCVLRVTEREGQVALSLHLEPTKGVPGVMTAHGGHNAILTVPASVFGDKATRAEWVNKSLARLKRYLVYTMMHEAALLNGDAGNYYLDFMGIDPEPTTKKELVKIHLNETEKRVAAFMGARGQRSQWTRAELERAVSTARRSIKGPRVTLDDVAEALRRMHPHKAPASGEALGTMLRRFKIKWKGIKTDS